MSKYKNVGKERDPKTKVLYRDGDKSKRTTKSNLTKGAHGGGALGKD